VGEAAAGRALPRPQRAARVISVDLSGGIAPEREFVFAQQPSDPAMRESVNVWVWDAGPASRRRA